MSFDFKTIGIYILGLILVLLFLRILRKPLIWVLRLMLSCIIGAAVIFLLNLILLKTGFHLAVNPFNAMTVGVLGIPGLILLGFFTLAL